MTNSLTEVLKAQAKVTPGGADALTRTEAALRRFVWFPEPRHFDVVTLWTAYTHLLTRCPDLPVAPRLGFFSGSPGSGKTRALEILSRLAANGQDVGSLSAASMLRIISAAASADEPGAYPVTLFPDELDRTYSANSAGNQDDLTIILNSGYKRGAVVVRAHKDKQQEVIRYPCFGPVAFAGLATARLPDALLTRTFVVHTKRARREERPDSFLPVAHGTELDNVRTALSDWAAEAAVRIADPADMLALLLDDRITSVTDGRDHEIWSCLFLTAVLAGGVWPERCLAAIEAAKEDAAERVDGSASARLLTALRLHHAARPARVWPVAISKDDIASAVIDLDPLTFQRFSGPDELRAEDVAALLREHGLKQVRVRTAHGRSYGYRWSALADAWERALPPLVTEDDEEHGDEEAEEEAGSLFRQ
ncbi:DUF3631 domain-containing protein [Streptomyces yunnanensis]|uniref:DUF3631 domain-containing protein n=1 Tax=Streptomyces yunnanensis TaxID=156453 RepID=A0ABY8AGQ9_9ACTN|nr:DUF3631 domain-containing protein [Streptomyces yunnanensis]WEB42687.1 DUF3631 domain-containing protein [Streptomyces yunnanensis]